MNTGEDTQGMQKIAGLSRSISVLLLLLHFYYYCYGAFLSWKLTSPLSDRVLETIVRTGLFNHLLISKGLALVFLVFSFLEVRGRKEVAYRPWLVWTSIGFALFAYFGSVWVLAQARNPEITAYGYMLMTFMGYLMVLAGGVQLSRFVNPSYRRDYFSPHPGGLRQEERLLKADFSINLPAEYSWKGQIRKSFINFINPRRGILIMGSPGSGKSWFIIEPAIRQLIEKGFALFVYDFKFPVLTGLVYSHFLKNRAKYPPTAAFFCINFTDLSHSHRCNLIDPSTLRYISDAIGISRTILLSMNRTWVNKEGDFFVESPINFLAALIWWLRKYKDGLYCTLPHVIELAQVPYEELFTLLNTEPEIQTLINPFIQAFENDNFELLDSQVASARIPLGRLASPDLYYILTGNDLSLDINNPRAPKILCLGGNPPRQEALAPILSLYIDRLNKLINQPGKYPCAIVCDEFATVRATSVLTTIATARSNNIIPIVAVQDLSQLKIRYSHDEASQVINTMGNVISGQVAGETARSISQRFPDITRYSKSVSVNSSDTSISSSEHMTGAVSAFTIATLSSGEFVGIVADDPGTKMELKAFHATIVKEAGGDLGPVELAVVRLVDAELIEENFQRVKSDVKELVAVEMNRIMANPNLTGLIIKSKYYPSKN